MTYGPAGLLRIGQPIERHNSHNHVMRMCMSHLTCCKRTCQMCVSGVKPFCLLCHHMISANFLCLLLLLIVTHCCARSDSPERCIVGPQSDVTVLTCLKRSVPQKMNVGGDHPDLARIVALQIYHSANSSGIAHIYSKPC